MRVLGIETSCDETGIAVYDTDKGLLAHQLYSQVKLHADYGGVVPELASRDHVRKTLPLIKAALKEAGISRRQLDGIAYTMGPGLVGALLVSGGHTQLVQVKAIGDYHLLGESVDDAAGEAFDKTAKLMGLEYPGGPRLAALAEQGNSDRFTFPRPMTDRPGLNFSFSGLKTSAANTLAANDNDEQTLADIARAFEDAVVDTLVIKCRRALKETGYKRLVVAGGVSANKHLRMKLEGVLHKQNGEVFYPRTEFCTDNGAMIALAGALRLQAGEREPLTVKTHPRWPMTELKPMAAPSDAV